MTQIDSIRFDTRQFLSNGLNGTVLALVLFSFMKVIISFRDPRGGGGGERGAAPGGHASTHVKSAELDGFIVINN